ncbi:uncharacterized protein F5147DRAFT_838103 [Suillus discolor]|uniref:Uncharacterized protein n=1 Tax=Suillus discolor TaxID=1912936 RepID=A0A9P7F3G7_9AGAM|nr:uncharacterized protein F5147DRAFT_838103 [Suillus discolor]KAG2105506.1 hypothetical protein F5147DRAFT_838103 [Suillus discolor]
MFIRPSTVLVVLLGLTALVSAGPAPVAVRSSSIDDIDKRGAPPAARSNVVVSFTSPSIRTSLPHHP